VTLLEQAARTSVFDRIVCAVDGSRVELEAVRQVCVLGSPAGQIELAGVVETVADQYSAYGTPDAVSKAEHGLAQRLAEARALCPRATTELLQGPRTRRLLDLIAETDASLVAVGATTRHRGVGIARGDCMTEMLHRSPSSVLVARAASPGATFPRAVVVGYDGLASADAALSVAHDLAERFRADIRVVAAEDAARAALDLEGLGWLTLERDDRSAVDALVSASAEADLLIVGSRGVRGVRALGSVAERVGHLASCSVLVVRGRQ
jgi:nucleotide-binding universal stress UspA family protein